VNKQRISCGLNIVDYIIILVAIGVTILYYLNNTVQFDVLRIAVPMLMVYLSVRLFSFIAPKKFPIIFIVLLVIICQIEICLGILQILGIRESNHYLYTLTGSFNNPGPYGGFISICLSLFIAFVIQNTQSSRRNISKLLYWSVTATIVLTIILLPSTQSRSAILALGCSMILLVLRTERVLARIMPIIKNYGVWILLVVILVGASTYLVKKPSADGRLFMNKICLKAMCANGWKGAGFGHFGGSYGENQAEYFKKQVEVNDNLVFKAIKGQEYMIADCPDNAFNEYLFIGVEAGPITMMLFVSIIVISLFLSLKNRTIWCYGLIAFSVFAFFSYPLHVKQFQLLLPALLGLCVSDITDRDDGNKIVGVSIMVVLFMTLSITRLLKQTEVDQYKSAISNWKETERWYNFGYYDYVIEDCEKLMPYLKNKPYYLFAYGQSLNKTGEFERSDSILQIGIKMSSDPMFWIVMGNNSFELKKYREAEERYKHAFYMVPNRLYPLYLLAKLYFTEGDITRFLDMAEMIESYIPKVESQNTGRLRHEILEMKSHYDNSLIKQDD